VLGITSEVGSINGFKTLQFTTLRRFSLWQPSKHVSQYRVLPSVLHPEMPLGQILPHLELFVVSLQPRDTIAGSNGLVLTSKRVPLPLGEVPVHRESVRPPFDFLNIKRIWFVTREYGP
jgi:hypothetical protein